MNSNYFESEEALESYLLSHYGTPEQRCTFHPRAREMGVSAVEFVTTPLRHISLHRRRRALDLGCATGRSTFELRRFFDEAVGVDRSLSFIAAAEKIQQQREITTALAHNRGSKEPIHLVLPPELATDHVSFEVGDACRLAPSLGVFDLVMLTQLIDRVADPARCLRQLWAFVEPGGWLVISTACNWQEKFAPKERWLVKGETGIVADACNLLAPYFELHRHFHMQYFVRERRYWYEWSVAEVSLWRRSSVSV